MSILLVGCTGLTGQCWDALDAIGKPPGWLLTAPEEFRVSSSPDPLKVVQHLSLVDRAREAGIPYLVSGKRMKDHVAELQHWAPDLILVAGWYYMVPRALRTMAKAGCVGIHHSLLPQYRGGAPVNWAILRGERKIGTTMFHLSKSVDVGDIVAQRAITAGVDETVGDLYPRLNAQATEMVKECVPALLDGTASRVPQDEDVATYFPLRRPEDGEIDWSASAKSIHDLVRAVARPYPGAFTYHVGERVTVWRTSRSTGSKPSSARPGEVVAEKDGRPVVAARDGLLVLEEYDWVGAGMVEGARLGGLEQEL